MMLERDVDQLLVRQAKLRGIECIKVASVAHRGIPDRMLIGPRRHFGFVEVKRGRAPVSGLQHAMLAKLSEAGVWARILWGGIDRPQTLTVVEQLLDDYLAMDPFSLGA